MANAQQRGCPVSDMARTVAWQNHRTLNRERKVVAGPFNRFWSVLRKQGWSAIQQRLIWRAYQRWPHFQGAARRSAINRFAGLTLGVTLSGLASINDIRIDPLSENY
jgi:hypothetical protein